MSSPPPPSKVSSASSENASQISGHSLPQPRLMLNPYTGGQNTTHEHMASTTVRGVGDTPPPSPPSDVSSGSSHNHSQTFGSSLPQPKLRLNPFTGGQSASHRHKAVRMGKCAVDTLPPPPPPSDASSASNESASPLVGHSLPAPPPPPGRWPVSTPGAPPATQTRDVQMTPATYRELNKTMVRLRHLQSTLICVFLKGSMWLAEFV